MSYLFNTRNGTYGFVVKYSDGTMLSEFDHTWDEIPTNKPIQSLMLWNNVNDCSMLELIGYDRFFFSNEAVYGAGVEPGVWTPGSITLSQSGALAGKIFGGLNFGVGADEIRVDMTSSIPKGVKRQYHESACSFAPHAMRPGMGRAI